MVGVPPQRAPMLVLGFLPIDSSILAGIPVHLMHLEIHSSNKRNLEVEGLLPGLLVVPMPMFLQLTFRRHTTQLEDGTTRIAYHMGLLGLAPSEQFNGGAF